MIRGIIFDCFGVLYGGSFGTLKSMCPADKLDELKNCNKQVDYGYISTNEYAETVAELLGVTPEDIFTIFREHHIRNKELVDYAYSLKPEYKVGLLSNVGSDTMDTLFPPEEQKELFDAVVLSYREGVAKPSREAFELIAEQMGLSTTECIMIDDLEENVAGAIDAGMSAVQHETNEATIQSIVELTTNS